MGAWAVVSTCARSVRVGCTTCMRHPMVASSDEPCSAKFSRVRARASSLNWDARIGSPHKSAKGSVCAPSSTRSRGLHIHDQNPQQDTRGSTGKREAPADESVHDCEPMHAIGERRATVREKIRILLDRDDGFNRIFYTPNLICESVPCI